MLKEPFFVVKKSQTCSFCGLKDIFCTKMGRSWACFFCLRQALNAQLELLTKEGSHD